MTEASSHVNPLRTAPNLLTLLRICLAPFLVAAILDNRYQLGFYLFVIAGLTDALDGALAGCAKGSQSSAAASASAAAENNPASASDGGAVYVANCSSCHQTNGQGVPGAFPPLSGDPVVNAANPTEHIATVLHGLKDKTIGSQSYSAEMPAFAEQLSDAQIANIIDHERTPWGNSGALITAADVAKVHANPVLSEAEKPATAPS